MSGKNKRALFSQATPFNLTEETSAPTMQEADSDLYRTSKFDQLDAQKITATLVSIFQIYPDVTQPRRAMPSLVRAHWDGNAESIGNLLDWWAQIVNEERAQNRVAEVFDVLDLITATSKPETPDDELVSVGYLEAAYLEIIQLAASIRRDGLTNPITIMRTNTPLFRLETGERRWLAYHLLNALFPDDEKWKAIPARKVESFNVWRQASENAARQDLNAIGKARQYAMLVMDLLSKERGLKFRAFNQFNNEREYYAQVANGADYDTPKGKAELLVSAMGLKNKVQLRQLRRLLRLPDDVWRLADDYNLQEGVLRRLAQDAGEDDVLLTQMVAQEIQQRVTPVTPSKNQADATVSKAPHQQNKTVSHHEGYLEYKKLGTLRLELIGQMNNKKKQRLKLQIQSARKYLDLMEHLLGNDD
jgi:hypothetical protein